MKAALTIPFGVVAPGGESHWIRLRQVAMRDDGVTLAQAAELVDALYDIEPCDGGMGNGGEAAKKDAAPDRATLLDKARNILKLGLCDGPSSVWETEVDVMRSHQADGYSLQGARIEVGEAVTMRRVVVETVELDGASHDLQWPYGGDIKVSGGAVVADVRGSTIRFARPVRGRCRIRYTTVWDRVKIKVRRYDKLPDASIYAVSVPPGAAKPDRERERDDSAAVVAFWCDLAAECALTRPPAEDDQGLSWAEIERICNPQINYHLVGDCWQTIERYNICNCSGREAPDAPAPEEVDVPCPERVAPGAFLGTVRELGEYVDCDKENEGLADRDYYYRYCCEEPTYDPLPRCRETREVFRGGEEIERGPEYWQGIYGADTRLVPVVPEGGICGEIIRKWRVPSERDCGSSIGGDDCETAPDPKLPKLKIVAPNSEFELTVSGGKGPFTWHPPHRIKSESPDGARTVHVAFNAADSAADITVTDACGRSATCRARTPEDIRMAPGDVDKPGTTAEIVWGFLYDRNITDVSKEEHHYVAGRHIIYYYTAFTQRSFSDWALNRTGKIINEGQYLNGLGVSGTNDDRVPLIPFYDRGTCRTYYEETDCPLAFVKGDKACVFGYKVYSEARWDELKKTAKWTKQLYNGWIENHDYSAKYEERDYSSIADVFTHLKPQYEKGETKVEKAGSNSFYTISYYYENGVKKEQRSKYYYVLDSYNMYSRHRVTLPHGCW